MKTMAGIRGASTFSTVSVPRAERGIGHERAGHWVWACQGPARVIAAWQPAWHIVSPCASCIQLYQRSKEHMLSSSAHSACSRTKWSVAGVWQAAVACGAYRKRESSQ